jgi:voltage-gated potassium channel
MKSRVHKFLNESFLGSVILTSLIFLSVLIFSIETEYPEMTALNCLNVTIALIFMIEYFARIWVADYKSNESLKSRLSYIFSFYGIVDLISFLPILLSSAFGGSTVLRLLRVMRLIQIMKIRAITKAIRKVSSALSSSKNELIISSTVSIALVFIGAVLMYFVEGTVQPEAFGSVPRALWWSIATLTTVGYGDVYPITTLGKLIAAFVAFVGIAAVAMPAGKLAAAFTKGTDKR